ncbi:MAG: DNA topoisomerase I [Methanobacteriota archaeon]
MNILVICEKNDAAQKIAFILSGRGYEKRFVNKVPIYHYARNNDDYHVIGLRGHIVELDYPKEYARWDADHIRKLVWVEPEKRPSVRGITGVLESLARDVQEVIVATDFDREGELIGVEAADLVVARNPSVKLRRARFSAFTRSEVETAFDNLTDVDQNLAKAAESRQIIDLAWGAVLTRFMSLATGQHGRDFLSVGRVQSPTLALIVDRENEINQFVPKPFWELLAQLDSGGAFTARHEHGVFWEKAEIDPLYAKVKEASEALVSEVKVEKRPERPPTPFNTTIFLTEATRMGITAPNAMAIAERLYTSGFISYPRTDNTVYPKSLNLDNVLRELTKSSLGKEAEKLLGERRQYPMRGKTEATDHPPIYPVAAAKEAELKGDAWKVYELVVRRFFATLAPDAHVEATEAWLKIAEEPFKAFGHRMLELGWYSYYPYYKPREISIPQLANGQPVKVTGIELLEDRTKPPRRFSQGDMIQEMERLGLGTKSTRHEILQKLYDRRYVESSPLRPTVSGTAVVKALEDGAMEITRPEMTAMLEDEMSRIADGQRDLPTVVRESQEILEKALIALESKVETIREDVNQALRQQKCVGACPQCGKDLLIRQSRNNKRFVGCSGYPECTNTYPLPQTGLLVTTDEKCGNCGAPAVKLIFRGRRPRMICVNMGCGARERKAESPSSAPKKKAAVRVKATVKKTPAKPKKKASAKK